MRDLYAVLGVAPTATREELRRAYLALLRRYHPDTREATHGSAAESADLALQEVQAAYETLRDLRLRTEYDRTRSAPLVTSTSTAVPVRRRRVVGDVTLRAGPVRWRPSRRDPGR
jgi:curved DNA-binding protein CbpA